MNKYKWRICIKDAFNHCENIYPIQQKKVKTLLDEIKNNQYVKKIVIFGSSVTPACHIGSDVDVYVELDKNISKKDLISDSLNFVYDLWTNYMVDERLLNEINEKGLVVYERV